MLRSGNYSVSGDQWPVLLYKDEIYDPENPWAGLFKNRLLVLVTEIPFFPSDLLLLMQIPFDLKAFKHIFTSPSSVDKEPKATRSGNARIHGMTSVTIPSLAYVATQVPNLYEIYVPVTKKRFHQARFSLTSSPIFSRTDLTTDSERFYNSVVEFLEDPDENVEVQELLVWWNR